MKKTYPAPKLTDLLSVMDLECWCDICMCKRWISKPGIMCTNCKDGAHKKEKSN